MEKERKINRNFLYCRVSTDDKNQEFDRQLNIAENTGILFDETFCEKVSGGIKATDREEFKKLYDSLKEGDTLYVSETSRLGRNYIECFEVMDLITVEKKCNIVFITNGIRLEAGEKMNPYTWLTLSQMLVFDEFQKRQISYMVKKGLEAKKALGVKLGRKLAIDEDRIEEFRDDYYSEMKILDMATKYDISIPTVHATAKRLALDSRNKKRIKI